LVLFDEEIYQHVPSVAGTKQEEEDQQADVRSLNLLQAVFARNCIYFGPWASDASLLATMEVAAPYRTGSRGRIGISKEIEAQAVDAGNHTLLHTYEEMPSPGLDFRFLRTRRSHARVSLSSRAPRWRLRACAKMGFPRTSPFPPRPGEAYRKYRGRGLRSVDGRSLGPR
jgi:hypothetical protein